jgi:hypothetical protein
MYSSNNDKWNRYLLVQGAINSEYLDRLRQLPLTQIFKELNMLDTGGARWFIKRRLLELGYAYSPMNRRFLEMNDIPELYERRFTLADMIGASGQITYQAIDAYRASSNSNEFTWLIDLLDQEGE